jgi:hypothetical protein
MQFSQAARERMIYPAFTMLTTLRARQQISDFLTTPNGEA